MKNWTLKTYLLVATVCILTFGWQGGMIVLGTLLLVAWVGES